jgi:hypothetical protein
VPWQISWPRSMVWRSLESHSPRRCGAKVVQIFFGDSMTIFLWILETMIDVINIYSIRYIYI